MKKHHSLLATGIAALCALTVTADAASTISRLTPPSALFTFGDATPPIISRFLPGQRFDLQCTVRPDAGLTVLSVAFLVDNAPVSGPIALTTTGLVAGLPAGTTSAALRAYSTLTPGVHTLKATATFSDSSTVTAQGNFEIVREPGRGALKKVIVMIGDGMGAAHRTAARIMSKGVQMGKANDPLVMDTFPFTGMVETSSLNSIVTDSAPGAACYSTGNKSNNNQQGVFPDDTTDAFDNPRMELIGEFLARKRGTSLGIVTTADVFDATPAAFGSHTQNRGAGSGICDGYLDEQAVNANLRVLLGGGRKWFLPNTTTGSGRTAALDSVLPSDVAAAWNAPIGAADPGRDLLSDFQTAGFTYTPDKTSLSAAVAGSPPSKLLGLFSYSNMNVSKDKIDGRRGATTLTADYGFPDQPMLDEMTSAALKVLDQNPNGFVLMVEGASIDKQAHNMDSERFILDTIEFDRAIGVAKAYAQVHKDTLIVITADHECAGVSIIGASTQTNATLNARVAANAGPGTDVNGNGVFNPPADTPGLRLDLVGTYEAAGFPTYTTAADGYPVTTDIDFKMLIGYGANADRFENWLTNQFPLQDSQQPTSNPAWLPNTATPYNAIRPSLPADPAHRDTQGNFFITGQVADATAAHTASDIPLSAFGRGASKFTGYYDNTEVFFKVMSLFGVR